ncbi:MAG: formimidoylglutamase [Flammeovirgaceae bacterium]
MNLRLFFDRLTNEQVATYVAQNGLAKVVDFHLDTLPNWVEADVAFFTVNEYRGNPTNQPDEEFGLDQIRAAFYQLSNFSKSIKLIDLGHMRLGESLTDTNMRLAEVCELLISQNTLPIIIGGSHDLDVGQFLAYQHMDKLISVVNVDARIDLMAPESHPAQQHVHQILTHHPNYLFDYNHLAYQRYLNPPKSLETLRSLNLEAKSTGEIRGKLLETEPIVRMGDMLSFDLSALKKADSNHPLSSPFGLSGEAACQLCWYAGLNEKMTSFGIYEYNASLDTESHTAAIVGIMVWYFIEGFCHRKAEYSFKSNFHIKYHVPMNNSEQVLVFYKSKVTEKWWLEVGDPTKPHAEFGRKIIIPCSYADYETANRGDLPERWIKAQDKIG